MGLKKKQKKIEKRVKTKSRKKSWVLYCICGVIFCYCCCSSSVLVSVVCVAVHAALLFITISEDRLCIGVVAAEIYRVLERYCLSFRHATYCLRVCVWPPFDFNQSIIRIHLSDFFLSLQPLYIFKNARIHFC